MDEKKQKPEKIPTGAKADKIIQELKDRDKESSDLWSTIHTDYNQANRFTNAKNGQWDDGERERMGEPCIQENRVLAFSNFVINGAVKQDIGCTVEPVSEGANAKLARVRQAQIMKVWDVGKGKQAAAGSLRNSVNGGFGVIYPTIGYADKTSHNKKIIYRHLKDPTIFKCDPTAIAPAMADMKYAIVTWKMSKGGYTKQFGEWEEMRGNDRDYWEGGNQKVIKEYWRLVKGKDALVMAKDGKSYRMSELSEWDENKTPEGIAQNPKPELDEDAASRPTGDEVVEQYIIANDKILKKTIWPGCRLPYKVVEGREYWDQGKKTLQSMGLHAQGPQRKLDFIESQKMIMYSKGPLEMVFVPTEGDSAGLEAKIQDAVRNGSKNVIVITFKSVDENGNRIGQPNFKPQQLGDPFLTNEANASIQAIEATFGIRQGALMARPSDASGVSIHATEEQADTSNFDIIDNWLSALEEIFIDTLYIIPKLGISMQLKLAGDDQKESLVWINNQALAMQGQVENYDLDEDEEYSLTLKVGPNQQSMRDKSFDQMMQYAKMFPTMAALIPDLAARGSLNNNYSDEIAERANRLVQHTAPWALSQNANPQMMAAQQQIQMQQQQMQAFQAQAEQMKQAASAELMKMKLQIEGMKSDKSNETLKIQLEAQAKAKSVEVDSFNALTNRLKVEQAAAAQVLSPAAMLADTVQDVQAIPQTGAAAPMVAA